MLELRALPAFNDNYIWVFGQTGSGSVCVVDPGAAEPVLRHLQEHTLRLDAIVLTHHHADHIGGVQDLLHHAAVPVYGPRSVRMACVTHSVADGDEIALAGQTFRIMAVPGHKIGRAHV